MSSGVFALIPRKFSGSSGTQAHHQNGLDISCKVQSATVCARGLTFVLDLSLFQQLLVLVYYYKVTMCNPFQCQLKIISSPILSHKASPYFFWCLMSLDTARALYIHAIYNHLFSYAIYVDPFASSLFTYTPHAGNNSSQGK
jgi:hypothetical protein